MTTDRRTHLDAYQRTLWDYIHAKTSVEAAYSTLDELRSRLETAREMLAERDVEPRVVSDAERDVELAEWGIEVAERLLPKAEVAWWRARRLTCKQSADLLCLLTGRSINPRTFSGYVSRHQAPQPDGHEDGVNWWSEWTIRRYAARPTSQGSRRDLLRTKLTLGVPSVEVCTRLVGEATDAIDQLRNLDRDHAVSLTLDGSGTPDVGIIDLNDPQATTSPYTVIIDHDDDLDDPGLPVAVDYAVAINRVVEQWVRDGITEDVLWRKLRTEGCTDEVIEAAISAFTEHPDQIVINGVALYGPAYVARVLVHVKD